MTAPVSDQLRRITERDFQRSVTDLCDWLHLDWWHPLNSRGMRPGWPDLVIVGNRILYRELKTESGVISAEQRHVGHQLGNAGADWAIWRPRDLRNGVIERQLHELIPPMLPFATTKEDTCD
jgi:hypothetical protein